MSMLRLIVSFTVADSFSSHGLATVRRSDRLSSVLLSSSRRGPTR